MPSMLLTPAVLAATAWATDKPPEPEDVKAGSTAVIVLLLLIAAVVVLAFSLVKQLRKAEAARKAGVFGPVEEEPDVEPDNRADVAKRADDGPPEVDTEHPKAP